MNTICNTFRLNIKTPFQPEHVTFTIISIEDRDFSIRCWRCVKEIPLFKQLIGFVPSNELLYKDNGVMRLQAKERYPVNLEVTGGMVGCQ